MIERRPLYKRQHDRETGRGGRRGTSWRGEGGGKLTDATASLMSRLCANRHELPPLRMRELLIDDDPLGGVATEGGFRTSCRMELPAKYPVFCQFG